MSAVWPTNGLSTTNLRMLLKWSSQLTIYDSSWSSVRGIITLKNPWPISMTSRRKTDPTGKSCWITLRCPGAGKAVRIETMMKQESGWKKKLLQNWQNAMNSSMRIHLPWWTKRLRRRIFIRRWYTESRALDPWSFWMLTSLNLLLKLCKCLRIFLRGNKSSCGTLSAGS